MSHAFTFGFEDDGVEEEDPNLLNETQTDIRKGSAMQMNSLLEEPKLHSLQEMVQ